MIAVRIGLVVHHIGSSIEKLGIDLKSDIVDLGKATAVSESFAAEECFEMRVKQLVAVHKTNVEHMPNYSAVEDSLKYSAAEHNLHYLNNLLDCSTATNILQCY